MFHPQGPTFWELAHQALSSTERGYDLLADKFDYTPFCTPSCLLQTVADEMAQGDPIDSAIDLCCGTGAAMRALRPLCRQRLVGIDFSQRMLQVAEQKLSSTPGSARLQFVHGDVLAMRFDAEFDLAVCFGALGHILPRDQEAFVRRVAQALREGGSFVFVSSRLPSKFSKRYWLSRGFNAAMHARNWLLQPPFIMYYLTFLLPEAARLLEAAGFAVETREKIFPPPFEQAFLVIARKQVRGEA